MPVSRAFSVTTVRGSGAPRSSGGAAHEVAAGERLLPRKIKISEHRQQANPECQNIPHSKKSYEASAWAGGKSRNPPHVDRSKYPPLDDGAQNSRPTGRCWLGGGHSVSKSGEAESSGNLVAATETDPLAETKYPRHEFQCVAENEE